jgi:hypothetical protein
MNTIAKDNSKEADLVSKLEDMRDTFKKLHTSIRNDT